VSIGLTRDGYNPGKPTWPTLVGDLGIALGCGLVAVVAGIVSIRIGLRCNELLRVEPDEPDDPDAPDDPE
jgi:hypothetical protein